MKHYVPIIFDIGFKWHKAYFNTHSSRTQSPESERGNIMITNQQEVHLTEN